MLRTILFLVVAIWWLGTCSARQEPSRNLQIEFDIDNVEFYDATENMGAQYRITLINSSVRILDSTFVNIVLREADTYQFEWVVRDFQGKIIYESSLAPEAIIHVGYFQMPITVELSASLVSFSLSSSALDLKKTMTLSHCDLLTLSDYYSIANGVNAVSIREDGEFVTYDLVLLPENSDFRRLRRLCAPAISETLTHKSLGRMANLNRVLKIEGEILTRSAHRVLTGIRGFSTNRLPNERARKMVFVPEQRAIMNSVTLFDLQGRKIPTSDLQQIPPGLYVWRSQNNDGITSKMIWLDKWTPASNDQPFSSDTPHTVNTREN